MAGLLALSLLASLTTAQQIGHAPEYHPKLVTRKCTTKYGCTKQQTSVVLDSTSHAIKDIRTGKSCLLNGGVDPSICSTVAECADRCALQGVNYEKNGVFTSGDSITLRQYLGTGSSIRTVSPRVYLLDEQGQNYDMLKMTNQEFSFTVDVSDLPCGMNGALYFSEMERSGGRSKMNPAGAQYGTGYCDAQCYKSTFINGVANLAQKGSCCMEMDIWEANSASNQLAPHPCNNTVGLYQCTGAECDTTCDKAGCGYNPYSIGAHNFYGLNASATVDTVDKFQVVTQFLTNNGKKNGNLSEIRRLYVQNGKVIQNAAVTFNGMTENSITPEYCSEYNSWNTAFPATGGLPGMGNALQRGMVLIMSIWNTNSGNMSWLDSGSAGYCDSTQDSADQIRAEDPGTSVTFSDIRWGDIGSTY